MAPTRRIGSGRILTHNMWDFRLDREKDSDQQVDYTFQRSGSTGTTRDRERDRDRDERYIGSVHLFIYSSLVLTQNMGHVLNLWFCVYLVQS
jgi:hypothetical protein